MRKFLFSRVGIALAALLLGSTPALAQSNRSVEVKPLSFLNTNGEAQRVDLLLGKARIIKLQSDARDVLVVNPSVADVVLRTPRLVYVLGREAGDTDIFFFDAAGNEILRLVARVEQDLATLRATLERLLPRVDIEPSSVRSNIFLSGTVQSAVVAEDAVRITERFAGEGTSVVSMLRIAEDQQVVLRVRIAEMERTATKELGLSYSFTKLDAGNFTGIGFDVIEAIGAPSGIARAAFSTPGTAFAILIDALEDNGLVKTLAEPSLTALSGESANFLAGGEFPFPVAQEGDTITIQFRSFGVALDFVPVVLDSGRISLRVSTEVSSIDFGVAIAGTPGLNVRRTSTVVELPSGGSMVIGGLLEDNITSSVNGIPGLKDLPVLGALFRSARFLRRETELVISVTAYLVNPIDEQQIALPTDGFAPASDIDLFLFGRLHATYAQSVDVPASVELMAPTGYIME